MFVSEKEHKEAIGKLVHPAERMYYTEMYKLFRPKKMPSPGDWLYSHKENHQSFDSYKEPHYNPITANRKTIYIQQFGKFDKNFVAELSNFCRVFYSSKLVVKILPVIDFDK